MASPLNDRSRLDAIYDWAGLQVFNYIRKNYPNTTRLLDVGAGWGKYAYLFPDYPIEAVEIWGIYTYNELLDKKYLKVHQMDICDYPVEQDVVIMGDVLEHIDRPRAKALIERITAKADVVVVLPFEYEQGETDGNPYEAHQQPDLTPELMTEEYPQLRLLAKKGNRAVYVRGK